MNDDAALGVCACPGSRQGIYHNQGCIFGGLRSRATVVAGPLPPNFRLTIREREVARLMVEGQSNKSIALALVITVRTVKAHMTCILAKTGSENRTQAAHRLGSSLGTAF